MYKTVQPTIPSSSYNKMKSLVLAASLLGSLAAASPLMEEKRYLVTSVVMETATVTVTGGRGWWPWVIVPRRPLPTQSL